ncbi:MAG: YbjN domain-containing protein [Clostridiales bacterium]|nr:YbjN domain-containing protein [Clostridiales bacterium]
MTDEKSLKQAKAVYGALCEMLNDRGWRYDKDEAGLSISCSAQGDDLPIELHIRVDTQRNLVSLLSPMPFTVAPNRRDALALAVSRANNGMVDGSFDYDYVNGRIVFRMTSSYLESLIGKNMFEYMLMCACYTIDEYNDKFLVVAKNEMSFAEIANYIK